MDGFTIGMIITGVTGLFLAILGIYMMITGHGSFLVAGYNTMSKEEKEKYDDKALCRFVGKFLIMVGLITVLFAIGITLGAKYSVSLLWITIIAYSIVVTAGSLIVAIFLNTGNRFRK